MKKNCFITFEGAEGSGKTTQIKAAAKFLKSKGYDVVLLREPGGTQVSEAIREILLNKNNTQMCPQTELLLYLAARAQIVNEKILPALKKGKIIICDRYEDSTLAYQGFGRGFALEAILKVSKDLVRADVVPQLTFLLDIDPAKGMKRGGRHDRMERQSLAFHRKVRNGFLKLAAKNKKRFTVIDSSKPIEQVTDKVIGKLKNVFK